MGWKVGFPYSCEYPPTMTIDSLRQRISRRVNAPRVSTIVLLLLVGQLTRPSTVLAQSLLERPPNVSGDWTGAAGTVYFNFLHRFSSSAKPERKVSSIPTLLLAAGLPWHTLVGVNYSTNSTLAPRFPNEYELFARWAPLSEDFGAPVDVGGQVGYNNAARGTDAEVSVARRFGVARLLLAGRALSDPFQTGHERAALAGGATIRLGTYVALAGDIASLRDRDSSEKIAWSAGLHLAIPFSPHTLSIQATNTMVNTLQGASRGTKNVRYGFEFTIPITLRRYFGNHEPPPAVVAERPPTDTANVTEPRPASARADSSPPTARVSDSTPRDSSAKPTPATNQQASVKPAAQPPNAAASPPPASVVRTGMRNIAYLRNKIEISVGSTVEWKNNDPLPHTVTAADKSFDSGNIMPGQTWKHTFTKPGTYTFYCTPHPFMKGVIVVRGS